jgi:hypothetical protein
VQSAYRSAYSTMTSSKGSYIPYTKTKIISMGIDCLGQSKLHSIEYLWVLFRISIGASVL